MIGRIEEGIDGRTAAATLRRLARPCAAARAAMTHRPGSLNDVVALILSFMRDRSDPPPAPQ